MIVDHQCSGGKCGVCLWNSRNGGNKYTRPHQGQPIPHPCWRPAPAPSVKPTRPRLVITLAVGTEGLKTHALTKPSQQRYAEKIGADYVTLTDATQDWFMLEKFRFGQWVPHYPGGTICIDADIWVSADAPDLLSMVPPEKIGVSISDDLHEHGLMPRFNAELREVCDSQGVDVPHGATLTHWNSGLVVLRPGHADYWTPPARPIPRHWIAEELWSKVSTFRHGWELFDLPHPQVHWQYWRDQPMKHLADKPYFVHPAGMTQFPNGLAKRLELFRQLEAGNSEIRLSPAQPAPARAAATVRGCGPCGKKKHQPMKRL